jgi:hypothetical protein
MLCGFRLWVDVESGCDSVCGFEVAISGGIRVFSVQQQAVD